MDNGDPPRTPKRSSSRRGNGRSNGPADPREESTGGTSRGRAGRGGGRVEAASTTPAIALADPPTDAPTDNDGAEELADTLETTESADEAASEATAAMIEAPVAERSRNGDNGAHHDAVETVEAPTDVDTDEVASEADTVEAATEVETSDAATEADTVEALTEVESPERIELPAIVPATDFDTDTTVTPPTEAVPLTETGDTDGTGGLPSKQRKPKPPRPLRAPVVVPRRRRPRVRRVTRVVRHVDTWSVFKIAVVFNAFLYGVCLTAGVLLWQVAQNTGTVDNIERFFESFGWETFELKGGEIYHNAWIAGLFVVVGLTGLAVLATTLFNLITDLVGGIRVSVLEEEVVAREDRGLGWRPRRNRRVHTVAQIPHDPPPVVEYAPPTIVAATEPPPYADYPPPEPPIYFEDTGTMETTATDISVFEAGGQDEPGPTPDAS